MNRDFQYQQRERLFVEQEIRFWVKRWREIESQKLREEVDVRVNDLLSRYDTQKLTREYHLDRYERLKNGG